MENVNKHKEALLLGSVKFVNVSINVLKVKFFPLICRYVFKVKSLEFIPTGFQIYAGKIIIKHSLFL